MLGWGQSRKAPGARLRARRGLLLAGCVLAVALWVGHAHTATLRGTGVSWRRVALATRSPTAGTSARGFTIGGDVGGLFPGDSVQLVLTVSNSFNFPIDVTSITTEIGAPNPGCVGSYLTVGAFSGHLAVPAGGSAQLSVPTTLSHAAPDACQGAVFPLTYSGLAVKR
jgi:hypothetical protein